MFIDASVQDWTELYEIAKTTKSLKPWLYFSDDRILALDLPGRTEPCYCIITGQHTDNLAIAVYPGKKSLARYSEYLCNKTTEDKYQVRCEQNYLICYFCDREDMLQMHLDKLKSLGISFRGKNEWIQFVSVRPGYAPYIIDKDEVLLLKQFFKQLNQFTKDISKGNIDAPLQEGTILYRTYDCMSKKFCYVHHPLDLPCRKHIINRIENETIIKKVKRLPLTDSELEIDLVYIDSTVYDSNLDRPAIGRLAVLGENSETLLGIKVVLPNKDPVHEIYEMLIQKIIERGRPRVIYCKRDVCYNMLTDFCNQAEIQLEKKKKLCLVDELVKAI